MSSADLAAAAASGMVQGLNASLTPEEQERVKELEANIPGLDDTSATQIVKDAEEMGVLNPDGSRRLPNPGIPADPDAIPAGHENHCNAAAHAKRASCKHGCHSAD